MGVPVMPLVYEYVSESGELSKGVITNLRYINVLVSDCGPVGQPATAERKGVSAKIVRLVLCALARRAKKTSLVCYPSIETISTDTATDKNTVLLALRAAEQQGWLRIQQGRHKKRKHHHRPPNQYELVLPATLRGDVHKLFRGYIRHFEESADARNPELSPISKRGSELSVTESDNPF